MLEDITFRYATINDLPIIVDIYNSTIPSRMVTADIEPVTVDDRLDWFNEHNPEKRPLWTVEYRGKTCGWVSLQSFYGRPAYNATAEISIYLHENYRGKGLGKKVLNKVIEECPKLEIDTLLAFIFGHNEPSIRLFSNLGFEKWGFLPEIAKLDGIKRDLVILGKKYINVHIKINQTVKLNFVYPVVSAREIFITTESLALEIAVQTGGDLRELVPEKNYSFDYNTA